MQINKAPLLQIGIPSLFLTVTILLSISLINSTWLVFKPGHESLNTFKIGLVIVLTPLVLGIHLLTQRTFLKTLWPCILLFMQLVLCDIFYSQTQFAPLISVLLAIILFISFSNFFHRIISSALIGCFLSIAAFHLFNLLLPTLILLTSLSAVSWLTKEASLSKKSWRHPLAIGLCVSSLSIAPWINFYTQNVAYDWDFFRYIRLGANTVATILPSVTTLFLCRRIGERITIFYWCALLSSPILFGVLWFSQASVALAFTFLQLGFGLNVVWLRYLGMVSSIGLLIQFYATQGLVGIDKSLILLITGIILVVIQQLIHWLLPPTLQTDPEQHTPLQEEI